MLESNPKLRPLEFQPVYYQGKQMWFLRDPLNLSSEQILIPYELTPLFIYLDGTKNTKEIHQNFCLTTGVQVPYQNILDAINHLDSACLLENERSKNEIQNQLTAYRSLPSRPPILAGHGYPDDEKELADYLDHFLPSQSTGSKSKWQGRGIISPHIDYHRGGPVYAQVWNCAAEAVAAAELVIILGTDHKGGEDKITLSSIPYETPFGVLPLEKEAIEILAGDLDSPYSDELHHRDEHSIELSAVWLHHTLKKTGLGTVPVIPILIGSFHHYIYDGGHPKQNKVFNRFIENLQNIMTNRKVLVVSSVDFAHVGPNFGDSFPVHEKERTQIQTYDKQLINAALNGDFDGWFQKIFEVEDKNRICGFSPTYFLLKTIGATKGQQIAYDQCPADENNTSIVSIGGLLID